MQQNNEKIDRRDFFSRIAQFVGLVPFTFVNFEKWVWAADSEPKKKPELIKETDPMAMALRYKFDASQAPANLKVKRQGVEGKDQTCKNCIHYKRVRESDGEEVGTCHILSGGLVKAKGWCISWAKSH